VYGNTTWHSQVIGSTLWQAPAACARSFIKGHRCRPMTSQIPSRRSPAAELFSHRDHAVIKSRDWSTGRRDNRPHRIKPFVPQARLPSFALTTRSQLSPPPRETAARPSWYSPPGSGFEACRASRPVLPQALRPEISSAQRPRKPPRAGLASTRLTQSAHAASGICYQHRPVRSSQTPVRLSRNGQQRSGRLRPQSLQADLTDTHRKRPGLCITDPTIR